jgi:hypothetical protein
MCEAVEHGDTLEYMLLTQSVTSLDSSASIVTGLWAGRPGFDFWQGHEIFIFATRSRPVVGPTQPAPTQWVPEALSLGEKRLGREAVPSAEVRNAWSDTSTSSLRRA